MSSMMNVLQELIHEVRLTRQAVERAGIPLASEMGRQASRLVDDKEALHKNNRDIMREVREMRKARKK